jgi:hypothetical protein
MTVLAAPDRVLSRESVLAHCPPASSSSGTTIDGHERRSALRPAVDRPLTLAVVIDTAWAGLQADAPIACPVCDGRMTPRPSASGAAGGKCRDCGTELS